MDYLKKYFTTNLFSICGCILGIIGLIKIITDLNFFKYFSIHDAINSSIDLSLILCFSFITIFLFEIFIRFMARMIYNKDLSININNKYYDHVFRLGLFICFLPIIHLTSCIINFVAHILIPIDYITHSSYFSTILFIIACFIFIKFLFFERNPIKNSVIAEFFSTLFKDIKSINNLKKYLTINIYSLAGLILLSVIIYYTITNPNIFIDIIYGMFSSGMIFILLMTYILCTTISILAAFLIEFTIHFITKKKLKKDLSIAINYKYYTNIFKLGLFFLILPILIYFNILIFIFLTAISNTIGCISSTIICILSLYIFIKSFFFDKNNS